MIGAAKGISSAKGVLRGCMILSLALVLIAAVPFGLAFLAATASPWFAAAVIAFFLMVSLALSFISKLGETKGKQSPSSIIFITLIPLVPFGSALAGGLIGSASQN